MMQIPLSQGMFALVDDEDYESLNQFKWYANKRWNTHYAKRNTYPPTKDKKHTLVSMHHLILGGIPAGKQVDHINGNGLDNRKENLRVVTARGNQQNLHTQKSSRYPGVCWSIHKQKWTAHIRVNGRLKNLGCFSSEIDAAHCYRNECLYRGFEYIGPIPPTENHQLEVEP